MFSEAAWPSIVLLSRFSHLVLPSPKNQASAAMCVQPNAVTGKAIQYMVLYCLTPAPFHRYSCLNLCPPSPARDGVVLIWHLFEGGGIPLVNIPVKMAVSSRTGYRPLITSHYPFQGVNVA